MLSKDLEQTLNDAFRGARAKRHEFMTVEHLLLALLDNNDAIRVLKACGADIGGLRGDLVEFVDATTPLIPEDEEERDTQPTLGFQRVLQRAVFHVQSSGKSEVTGANVLVAIFSEQESQAVFFLKTQSVARLDVVNYITHGISKVPNEDGDSDPGEPAAQEGGGEGDESNPLDSFSTNLNQEAAAGAYRPADRANRRGGAGGPDTGPQAQKQPLAGGRVRRGQDRHRGRSGQENCRWGRSRDSQGQRGVLAGPGRPAGGHQVPRRFREALQGPAG